MTPEQAINKVTSVLAMGGHLDADPRCAEALDRISAALEAAASVQSLREAERAVVETALESYHRGAVYAVAEAHTKACGDLIELRKAAIDGA